jgi:hypothetical protein
MLIKAPVFLHAKVCKEFIKILFVTLIMREQSCFVYGEHGMYCKCKAKVQGSACIKYLH